MTDNRNLIYTRQFALLAFATCLTFRVSRLPPLMRQAVGTNNLFVLLLYLHGVRDERDYGDIDPVFYKVFSADARPDVEDCGVHDQQVRIIIIQGGFNVFAKVLQDA